MSLTAKAYAALALVLMVLASLWYVNHLHSRIEKLEQENTELSADSNAHETYAAGSRELDREYRTTKEETREVLEANREWADQPVPSDVSDRLRNRTESPD